jgi:hypothetical protein
LDNFDDRYLGAKTSDPALDNDGNALAIGALYFNTTDGVMKVYTASGWIAASSASVATLATFEFVATAGQTVFTGNDANGSSLSYVAPAIIVTLNGVRLRPGDDYTATNGTSITLVSAAALNDELVVDAFGSFLVANTYTIAQSDANFQPKSNALTSYASSGVGMRNRIINGAMVISQRNGTTAVNNDTSGSQYSLDRWGIYGTQSSKFSAGQYSTAPTGFNNSIGISSNSAYTLNGTDTFWIQQQIEGYNVADLGFGTANAKTVTLSFWVRSSLTGTFGGSLRNADNTRCYPYSYTISSANTWEQKIVTIAGDTSGTWLTTNGSGIKVLFSLGSNYLGTAGSWTGSYVEGATGQTSLVGTNGANLYITGVQLEVGSTATSFDYRPYTTEMLLCQRYYVKSFTYSTVPANGIYSYYSGTFWEGSDNGKNEYVYLPVSMRASPTFTVYGDSGRWQVFNGGAWVTSTQSIVGGITDRGFTVFIVGNISNSSLHPWYCKGDWVASAEL